MPLLAKLMLKSYSNKLPVKLYVPKTKHVIKNSLVNFTVGLCFELFTKPGLLFPTAKLSLETMILVPVQMQEMQNAKLLL